MGPGRVLRFSLVPCSRLQLSPRVCARALRGWRLGVCVRRGAEEDLCVCASRAAAQRCRPTCRGGGTAGGSVRTGDQLSSVLFQPGWSFRLSTRVNKKVTSWTWKNGEASRRMNRHPKAPFSFYCSDTPKRQLIDSQFFNNILHLRHNTIIITLIIINTESTK